MIHTTVSKLSRIHHDSISPIHQGGETSRFSQRSAFGSDGTLDLAKRTLMEVQRVVRGGVYVFIFTDGLTQLDHGAMRSLLAPRHVCIQVVRASRLLRDGMGHRQTAYAGGKNPDGSVRGQAWP